MKRILALSLTLLAAASGSARAQDVWGWSVLVPSYTQTDILGTALRESTERPAASARPVAPSPAASPANLRFAPSPERRRANFARFLAERRGQDAASLKQAEALLARPDLMARIDAELGRYGLRADNVADAYAIWWITLWQTANGRTEDPGAKPAQAVKAQVERALLATPGLATADDAAKQAFAEGLLVQAMFLDAALQQSKADPAALRTLGAAARRNAGATGVLVDGVTLSDQGFTTVRG
ncbi:DUF6683 family protein [Phenylobacterium sp.]|uniref:DUF6683 family protein n=1 Tax=Phenylobacterium sp. TaxID=1871053 RepID=UPI002F95CA13